MSDQDAIATRQPIVAPVVQRLIAYGCIRRQLLRADQRLDLQIQAIERHDKQAGRTSETMPSTGRLSGPPLSAALLPLMEMRNVGYPERRRTEKLIAQLAEQLPVYPWIESVRGIGPFGLGVLIAETGDLLNYANPAKVWKRMGLAVIDGERQRRITDTELALKHGFSPYRRAVVWNLGDALIKQNKGVYRQAYDERKAFELVRGCKQGHAHNRAARYMTKRFLLHLWQEWRRPSHA